MKNIDLLRNSARQAIANKIAWMCVLVTLIGQIIPALLKSMPTINYVSSGVWFLSTILSVILCSGLVHSISQKELNNADTSVLEGWRKGLSKLIPVALLNILLVVMLFVVVFLIGTFLNKTIPYSPLTISLAFFLRPILIFGTCAIIINNGSIGASIWTSLSMFMRNIVQSLVIGGAFVIIQEILLGIVILFIFISPYRDMLLGSLTELSFSYFRILESPQVVFCDQVLALILYPWILIAFTHTH